MNSFEALRETVAKLRGPGGCPWDQEQTHQSLARSLVEECSELLETIDTDDRAHMKEELGDVLLQVVMHAQIEEEANNFNLEDVAHLLNEKLIRRHPHVFGDEKLNTVDDVLVRWEEIKAEEKKDKPKTQPPFKDLPPQLPALLFARSVYKQYTKHQLSADEVLNSETISHLSESLSEMEAGKKLFEISAACLKAGIDPEAALRRYSQKVIQATESI
tara:strand:+ start:12655 stop:13305 length:651 start_codon:yes stop_codon:yes gene_type:complete